jgi:hypothetical protein
MPYPSITLAPKHTLRNIMTSSLMGDAPTCMGAQILSGQPYVNLPLRRSKGITHEEDFYFLLKHFSWPIKVQCTYRSVKTCSGLRIKLSSNDFKFYTALMRHTITSNNN